MIEAPYSASMQVQTAFPKTKSISEFETADQILSVPSGGTALKESRMTIWNCFGGDSLEPT